MLDLRVSTLFRVHICSFRSGWHFISAHPGLAGQYPISGHLRHRSLQVRCWTLLGSLSALGSAPLARQTLSDWQVCNGLSLWPALAITSLAPVKKWDHGRYLFPMVNCLSPNNTPIKYLHQVFGCVTNRVSKPRSVRLRTVSPYHPSSAGGLVQELPKS